MTDEFDRETGEVVPNGSGARAAAYASQARVALQAQRMGIGQTNIAVAIEDALKVIPIWITTDKTGAHNISYATLKKILETVRPPLADRHVRIRQGAERSFSLDEGGGSKGRLVPVYTDFVHTISGEVERTTIEIPLTRLDPQSMGSAIMYGKRYSLLAGLGLATDEADDDGVRAMPRELSSEIKNSIGFDKLVAEMRTKKTEEALNKWGTDPATRKEINALSDAEAERLRMTYSDYRGDLGEEPKKAGK
jgi:hypothetical protein